MHKGARSMQPIHLWAELFSSADGTEALQHMTKCTGAYRQHCQMQILLQMPSSTCAHAHVLTSFNGALWWNPEVIFFFYVTTSKQNPLTLELGDVHILMYSGYICHAWSLYVYLSPDHVSRIRKHYAKARKQPTCPTVRKFSSLLIWQMLLHWIRKHWHCFF